MPEAFLQPSPSPKTNLGRYKVLSPNAGVHVSPMQLGAMSIGDKWDKFGMGSMDKARSFELLDAFFVNGGNFIDTANTKMRHLRCSLENGQKNEEFEINCSLRPRLILHCTLIYWQYHKGSLNQYTTNLKTHNDSVYQQILYTGNNAKSMYISVEASLKKLRTNYIDLLYLHWWDWDTSIEEVMKSLHSLVVQGKVLYLGVSDTPAWVVSKANQYARDHALTPFVVYQGAWNVMARSFEREIIPMARSEGTSTKPSSPNPHFAQQFQLLGMALAPWNVLAAGKIRTDEEEERRRQTGEKGRTIFSPNWERNDQEKKVCKALEKVAAEAGAKSITAVAIAYLMQKTTYVFPIVGGRKVEHLMSNIEALDISLSDEQIKYLESIIPFDPGFPSTFIGDGTKTGTFIDAAGQTDLRPIAQPLRPTAKS
ncbi:hypothetical protein CVT25_006837 [Psilocybe cyanescens]|uniref:NADP-dependent oxidoreductase domain-containing protein n=1 Tax=Psilocybe cyanescens TaxID=93625 RepID=A0A409X788_PSICY|nr:hypothetical protein CVT25_006837 [Psilocybe cyanescens]